jgi:hypothetical protein
MRIAAVLVLACVIGCGGNAPTAPEPAFLRFTSRAPDPGSSESAAAEAGRGQISVRATLAGPDPCRILAGQLEQSERQLTLRVSVQPTNDVCVLVVGRFAYDAAIERLAPGTYSLRVVHDYPATGWPTTTVLNQTLTVP